MITSEKFWDKVAKRYAKSPVKNSHAYEQTMDRTRARLSSGDDVLEIGCGTGSTALLLADSVKHITAVDISTAMIGIAAAKATDQQVGNVAFVKGTLFDAPSAAGPFDVVLAYNFLHLLEDPAVGLGRVNELLKPGGLFISKTVCMGEQARFWPFLLFVMQKLALAPYVNFLKIDGLEKAVQDAGFEIVEQGLYPATPPSRFIVAQKH